MYDLQLGFTFGSGKDTPQAIEGVLKRIGHLLINRNYSKNPILQYVNQILLQEVIKNNPITTIFQNDKRPLSGKFG